MPMKILSVAIHRRELKIRYGLSFMRLQMIDLAPTEQQHYQERTGIHRRLERYCAQFRAIGALRDPAPPA